jgi:hypothetical protein
VDTIRDGIELVECEQLQESYRLERVFLKLANVPRMRSLVGEMPMQHIDVSLMSAIEFQTFMKKCFTSLDTPTGTPLCSLDIFLMRQLEEEDRMMFYNMCMQDLNLNLVINEQGVREHRYPVMNSKSRTKLIRIERQYRMIYSKMNREDRIMLCNQMNRVERKRFIRMDAEERRTWSQMDREDRMTYIISLLEKDRMTFTQMNRDERMFCNQMNRVERKRFIRMGAEERRTWSQMDREDRMTYINLEKEDRMKFSQMGLLKKDRMTFTQMNRDERMLCSQMNRVERERFIGMDAEERRTYM